MTVAIGVLSSVVSLTTAGALALIGWRFLSPYIEKVAQLALETRLEAVRAEHRREEERLRSSMAAQEAQISALRSGTLSTISARETAIVERQIASAELLWRAVVALGPLKASHAFLRVLNLREIIKEASKPGHEGSKMRQTADDLAKIAGVTDYKFDPAPDQERLFLSERSWTLFALYRQALVYPMMLLQVARLGESSIALQDPPTKLIDEAKAALPMYVGYLDQHGVAGLGWLIEEIEAQLRASLVADVEGRNFTDGFISKSASALKSLETVAFELNHKLPPDVPRTTTPPPEP